MMDRQECLRLYETMLLIRLTEEELARCHQKGLIHGACHTYVGQEAVAAGICAHLGPNDPVFSTHRGHGHALAKGMAPFALMAELFGRSEGCSRGRGGSMHLFAPEIGMMGTSGIVGPSILQACGGGYSSKLTGNDRVSVAFFGDGAVNNGAFHEGLNMASIWKLPVLFVCENNQFATEVPFAYASGIPDVGRRAAHYGIEGVEVDGNDVLAVYQVAKTAVNRAKKGQGPTLVECKTYRTRAHAEGMGDFTYRTREEVDSWKHRCPINLFGEKLVTEFGVSQAELEGLKNRVSNLVEKARQEAEASPWPEESSAGLFVYSPSAQITAEPKPADSDRTLTFAQATLEALTEVMEEKPLTFVMGEGIGKRGGNFRTTVGLYDRHGPDRLCDTPICERGFVGLACGAAMTGSRPIIDFMFADFVLDGMGEIINQIAKMQYMSSGRLRMPIVLRGCIGVGHSAATHHSGGYYGLWAQVPGLQVVVPSNARDAKGLLKSALRGDNPVLFLEHREILQTKAPVPTGDYEIPLGKAAVVRPGQHVTVVALARMVHLVKEVATTLAREGIELEIIDPRTVLPLDTETVLVSLRKTGRLLLVDEAPGGYGLTAEIAARMADLGFDLLDAPIRRIQGAFAPTPYSPVLEKTVVPQSERILAEIRSLLEE